MNISILNPIETPDWDSLLLSAERATFFHTMAWARVLSESYSYKPLYFAAIDNGKLTGLIPVMEIDSFLTGKRGVSLPFTDICHPIADTPDIFRALMERLTQHGDSAGWKHIEIKGGGALLDGVPHCAEHCTHILELGRDEDKVQQSFRDSTRRNIRKAYRDGVEVSSQHTAEAMAAFYGLHSRTRRRHGLPPQPWRFFARVYEHVLAAGKGVVLLATHAGKTVAGAVYFFYRDCALFKFGASDRDCSHLRANNLVMWEAIRWCCCNGFRSLHFGRTESGNQGLLQFKNGWGAVQGKVAYYRFHLKDKVFSANINGIKTSYPVCKVLPIPVLKLAGRIFYRHVG
ncbi:MAG: GNAT family N-acetyltransferase [Deltaproteobacteria bacterium]|nr:GNAT family N-acetyltransferase [Deltaproteobacteria bacterium]